MYDIDTDAVMAALCALKPAGRSPRASKDMSQHYAGNVLTKEVIAQFRAARALLRWSQGTLAHYAKCTPLTISNFERGTVRPRNSTLRKVQAALESAGIVFIDDEHEVGIVLRT
jgi:ribosome-binding protein aMBF1 (putative translation factor)